MNSQAVTCLPIWPNIFLKASKECSSQRKKTMCDSPGLIRLYASCGVEPQSLIHYHSHDPKIHQQVHIATSQPPYLCCWLSCHSCYIQRRSFADCCDSKSERDCRLPVCYRGNFPPPVHAYLILTTAYFNNSTYISTPLVMTWIIKALNLYYSIWFMQKLGRGQRKWVQQPK